MPRKKKSNISEPLPDTADNMKMATLAPIPVAADLPKDISTSESPTAALTKVPGDDNPEVVTMINVDKPAGPAVQETTNPLTAQIKRWLKNMGPVIRRTGVFVGVFLLGLLAGIWFIYVPTSKQLAILKQENLSGNEKINSLGVDLEKVRQRLSQIEEGVASQQTKVDKMTARLTLFLALNQVTTSRLALLQKNGPLAQQALLLARNAIDQSMKILNQIDTMRTNEIMSQLDQASNRLASDPSAAAENLQTLDGLISQMIDKIK